MIPDIKEKNVLFITTKNLDYIRNVQEINLIKEQAASYKIIGSSDKSYFSRLLKVFFLLLASPASKFDTVFIGFAPQLILPLFKWKFKNKCIIIDFFISMYDTLCCDRKKISPFGIMGRFLHFMDWITLSFADTIVCDTKAHGKYFADEFGALPEKLYPLYLQADSSVYHPLPPCKPAFLQDKCVVLYFGSILPLQGTSVVLEAMSLLKDNKNLFFYFIGPVKEKNMTAPRPVSDNIKYIHWLSQEQLASHIGQADLCLAGHFSPDIDKARRTIPGKAYIYKAMRKPMILGDNSANHELFSKNSDTIFVEMGNADALADAILSFYEKNFCYKNLS